MMRIRIECFASIVFILSAIPSAVFGASVWEGSSGNLLISWSDNKLVALDPRSRAVVHDIDARKITDQMNTPSPDGDLESESNSYSFSLVSLVGSIASLEESHGWYLSGAAHSGGSISYQAVDLSNNGKPVSLVDLFKKEEVLSAFIGDSFIRKELDGRKLATPTSLEALQKALSDVLPADYLNAFAFHHLEGNKVAVRIGLSDHQWPPELIQLGLLLDIPEKMKSSLSLASQSKEGFLKKNAPSITGKP